MIANNLSRPSLRLTVSCIVLLISIMILIIESKPTLRVSQQENKQSDQQQHQAITKPIGQYKFTRYMEPNLELFKIQSESSRASGNIYRLNVTCNDGSPIGYYKRLNSHSKSWVIYLQGGGFCSSEESCQFRWQRTPDLMSSNWWSKTKQMDGILSSELKDNPYLWNANHIYIPYCSSDSWTGLAPSSSSASAASSQYRPPRSDPSSTSSSGQQPAPNSFVFMGSRIIERVFESLYEDLPRDSSLHEAKFILLAGDSAGATGVMMNLDKMNAFVQHKAAQNPTPDAPFMSDSSINDNKQAPTVRGLADSGWFLDNEPYEVSRDSSYSPNRPNIDQANPSQSEATDTDCDRGRCTPLQSSKLAMRFWNGQVPESCRQEYPTEPWRCYFGYRAYQTLKTPLFVVQWIYDEAQLLIDNIIRPDGPDQWSYINRLSSDMRASLENVTALFAPSCISHSLIIKKSWNQVNINGFKLPHLLNSWEEQSLLETTSVTPLAAISNIEKSSNYANPLPTFEALTMSIPLGVQQQTSETLLNMVRLPNAPTARATDSLQMISPQRFSQQASSSTTRPPRPRKRKRNNQQQRQRQTRNRSTQQSVTSTEPSNPQNQPLMDAGFNVQPNDLLNNSPMQDLLSLVDRSLISPDILFSSPANNARSSRSTIVDDSTMMLTNNVPDESETHSSGANGRTAKLLWPIGLETIATDSSSQIVSVPMRSPVSDRFRLIDSCGWPQCNRDCPNYEPDFSFGALF